MFASTSEKIVGKLEQQHIIPTEQHVIYQYGMNQALNTILNILTFMIIGMLFHMVVETVIFTVGYIPFRIYAGGFHAKTPRRCWILSGCMLVAALILISIAERFSFAFDILSVISEVLILMQMPVEDLNKPLDEMERHIYMKRGVIVFAVEAIVVVLFRIFHMNSISHCLQMVWVILNVMLILGNVKNKAIKKKDEINE